MWGMLFGISISNIQQRSLSRSDSLSLWDANQRHRFWVHVHSDASFAFCLTFAAEVTE